MSLSMKDLDKKAFEEKKMEEERKKAEAFFADYKEVCKKHGLQIVARMRYTDTGANAIIGLIPYQEDEPKEEQPKDA